MPATFLVLNDAFTLQGVPAQSINAAGPTSGSAIDLTNYEGMVAVVLNTGAFAAASTYVTITTDSASGGTYATTVMTSPSLLLAGGANQVLVATFDTRSCLRYVKANVFQTGAAATLTAVSLLAFKKVR